MMKKLSYCLAILAPLAVIYIFMAVLYKPGSNVRRRTAHGSFYRYFTSPTSNTKLAMQPHTNLTSCTNANHTTYRIINPQNTYVIGERIQVIIEAKDDNGRPQTSGGAFFRAKLVSDNIKAASRSDGEIGDFNNGSYLAEFILRWPGKVAVKVMLVHGNCAIHVIDRITREFPNRGSYIAVFKNGEVNETRTCNVDHVATPVNECDFTFPETNIGWFCEKPHHPKLTCEHWWWYNSNNTYNIKQQPKYLRSGEKAFFLRFKTYLRCDNCIISVKSVNTRDEQPDNHGRYSWQTPWSKMPRCLPGTIKKFDDETSGYYFQDTWYSTRCRNRQFDEAAISKCLTNKTVFINGDSTSRQWKDYLTGKLKTVKKPTVNCIRQFHQPKYNISIHFNFHGPPFRGVDGVSRECAVGTIPFVLNHLDFKPDVYVLAMGPHFSIHSRKYFAERVGLVYDAIAKLRVRNPRALVILKTTTTREFGMLSHLLANNEWYTMLLDRMLRETFSNQSDIVLVDAWDMTVAQFSPDKIHVDKGTLMNEVNLALSYICPT